MAKLTKEELIAKVNDKIGDNPELAVELMEDITDSFENIDLSAYVEKVVYDELLQKYKDRFMSGEEVKEVVEEEKEEVKEDDGVIDVQEIFEDEEKKEDEE